MFKNIEEIAENLEIVRYKNESDSEFHEKVIFTCLKKGGDPFHLAEFLTGKEYKTFDKNENMLALGLHIIKMNQKKEKSIRELDTYYNMPWDYYQEILKNNEFEMVCEESFNGENIETYQIWSQDKNGILLTAESFNLVDKGVNSTKAYFEIDFNKKYENFDYVDNQFYNQVIKGTSNRPISEKIGKNSDMIIVDYDGRSNLISKIASIEKSPFSFNNPWKSYKDHFLWLVNYSENKNKNYKEIGEEKLKNLPDKIKKMVSYKK